ncbi:MAG: type II toxin-antitoxin system RatA family toxin [Burkholderiales bacterium]|jgi:ribosome-associated toxin RatA of RatAB toxin-antitoxin module|nr:type II toxin-antitoxin system RatA family toxin [Burkholderiales bacterium]
MPDIERTVIVAHPAQRMFDLVDDVPRYPEFLPWCGGAEVMSRDDRVTRAAVTIAFKGLRQRFVTDNTRTPPSRIDLAFVEGPFRRLHGSWLFTALADDACKVQFRLHYEFSSRLLEKLIGPVFDHIAGTFVDRFIERADRTAPRP